MDYGWPLSIVYCYSFAEDGDEYFGFKTWCSSLLLLSHYFSQWKDLQTPRSCILMQIKKSKKGNQNSEKAKSNVQQLTVQQLTNYIQAINKQCICT